MFTTSNTVRINDGQAPALTPEQVWRGLQIRARNGDDRFVPPGHRFEIVEDNGDRLLRKVYLSDGVQELQRISFHGTNLVVFDFVEGPQLGMILCLIETDDESQYCLRMTFLSEFADLAHGSTEEAEFAAGRRQVMLGQPARVIDVIRELATEGVL